MQTRQMLLYGALGAVLLFMGGEWVSDRLIDAPLQEQEERKKDLKKKLTSARDEFNRALKTSDKLADWERRSLPRDPMAARTQYQAWLFDVVTRVGLADPKVNSSTPSPRRGIYHSLTFSLRVRGTLDQFTRFLYEFYRADFLHYIESIGITPLRNAGLLDLSLKIEALSLEKGSSLDSLPKDVSQAFAQAKLKDFDEIVRRNVFGVGGGMDAAAHTVLTAVPTSDGQPAAWFTVGTEDRVLKLKQGDQLEVGRFTATVLEISDSDVVLEAVGERWLISLGENLDQATALPPEF